MKKLMEILMELDDSIDWENETALIDERILDSFGVISLIWKNSLISRLRHRRLSRRT